MLVHVFVCRHKSINLQVLVLDSPIVLNRVFVIMWKIFLSLSLISYYKHTGIIGDLATPSNLA